MGDRHSFSATVRSEGSGVFVEVPLDVPSIFGKKRAPVRGAVNGTPFQSTVAVYGGRYFLPLNRALRERARVASGDEVSIVLELDETERRVEVPEDFASALRDAHLEGLFDRLSYSHQRAHIEAIEGAQRAATRERRIQKALEMIRAK